MKLTRRVLLRSLLAAPAAGALSGNYGVKSITRSGVDQGRISWTSIGVARADEYFIEAISFSVEEIARIYCVPPALLGRPTLDR